MLRTADAARTEHRLRPTRTLGRGFLTGAIRSEAACAEGDLCSVDPRFTGESFRRNLHLVDAAIRHVATEADATPAQVALAWLLAQGVRTSSPSRGTKRAHQVEENTADDALQLTADQLARLSSLSAVAGATHTEAGMRLLER
ncbi:aldo/keto reductase [Streptomyces sp. NPDC004237]|uniref:aldo/keto reductase n=1 Tax=Streptomyces sp. NPDC004237 TaxID=3154455 RepID=UPI0033B7ACFD